MRNVVTDSFEKKLREVLINIVSFEEIFLTIGRKKTNVGIPKSRHLSIIDLCRTIVQGFHIYLCTTK